MSVIKPFKGYRPPVDIVEKLASRPYDVLNSEEARKECEGNPYSLLHVTKAEIDLAPGTKDSDLTTYIKVVENFNAFKDYGWLVQDKEEKLYIYAQSMNPTDANAHWQYGIVACAWSEDYVNQVIKKHELTRKDKEEDRMKHVRITNANVEPVFFAYPATWTGTPYFEMFGLAWATNSDIVAKDNIQVADARGTVDGVLQGAVAYKLYCWELDTPLQAETTKFRVWFK